MGLEPEPAIRVKNPTCIALLCQCPPSCPLLQQNLLEAWASREGKTWCLQKAGNQIDKHIYCDIQCCGVYSYHLDQFLYVGFQLDCKLGKHHPLYIGVYTIHTPYLSDYRASLIKKLIIRSSRWQKQIEKKKKKKRRVQTHRHHRHYRVLGPTIATLYRDTRYYIHTIQGYFLLLYYM